MGSKLSAVLLFSRRQGSAQSGALCIPVTPGAVKLQSRLKSHHGEHFVATSDTNRLVGDGISCILWLFPLAWSRRGLWGVGVKSDWLLQMYFWGVGCFPCPIFCFYLQPPLRCPLVCCCPGCHSVKPGAGRCQAIKSTSPCLGGPQPGVQPSPPARITWRRIQASHVVCPCPHRLANHCLLLLPRSLMLVMFLIIRKHI